MSNVEKPKTLSTKLAAMKFMQRGNPEAEAQAAEAEERNRQPAALAAIQEGHKWRLRPGITAAVVGIRRRERPDDAPPAQVDEDTSTTLVFGFAAPGSKRQRSLSGVATRFQSQSFNAKLESLAAAAAAEAAGGSGDESSADDDLSEDEFAHRLAAARAPRDTASGRRIVKRKKKAKGLPVVTSLRPTAQGRRRRERKKAVRKGARS